MATLGVNIDHVATLRQARGGVEPSVLEAAQIAQNSGADAITVHLREDRRHIQDHDVFSLKEALSCRLNLEMAATGEMAAIAKEVLPSCCCIVPEKREELTTEGGLDVIGNQNIITNLTAELSSRNIEVSLFIDPDLRQIECARACGAPIVEIHTGQYANAHHLDREAELKRVIRAVEFAQDCGIQANAGHGLNYANTSAVAAIKGVSELNIGHAIVAHAIKVGLAAAVAEMKRLIVGVAR